MEPVTGPQSLGELLGTNRDVVDHTLKQLIDGATKDNDGLARVQRVAGCTHVWRDAASAMLQAKAMPLQLSAHCQKHSYGSRVLAALPDTKEQCLSGGMYPYMTL